MTAVTAFAGEPSQGPGLSEKQVHMIRCTYRLIGEHGVHRVSLQDIAEAAAVSKGLIPYYFKTKENLILATMRWVLTQVAERIRATMAGAETAEARLLAMLDVIFAEPEANRRFYVVYLDLVEYAAREHRFNELSDDFRVWVNGLYAEVIRAGVAEGAFHVRDVDEAAAGMRALIEGVFLQWLQEDDWRATHARYRDFGKRAVLTYLGARR
jgi:AcrR family transcriptional regulator